METQNGPADEEQWYDVPLCLQSHINCAELRFLRPPIHKQVGPEDFFAIRCNENYHDVKAALENERIYVRQFAMHAQQIWFYRSVSRQPILVVGNFDEKIIREQNRGIDAAVQRTIVVSPEKQNRFEIKIPETVDELYRVIGKDEDVQVLLAKAPTRWRTTVKKHHVPGFTVAHCFLKPQDIKQSYFGKLMFEKLWNIISSNNMKNQVTIRKSSATIEETMEVAKIFQQEMGSITLRTHAVLRATLLSELNAENLSILKQRFNGWKVFTDTPINAWGAPRDVAGQQQPKRTQQEPVVTEAMAEGKVVVKVDADYVIHHSVFTSLAQHFDGRIIKTIEAKYNDVPLAVLIALPHEREAEFDQLCLQGPFQVEELGNLYAKKLRGPKSRPSKPAV